MKKLFFLIPELFLVCFYVNSQNLILNPGFEFCSDTNNCIPSDSGQITNAIYWYSYNNSKIYLNGSNSWYPPDLFDKRTNSINCNVIKGQINMYNSEPLNYPIVGIPNNFLTLGYDITPFQQLDSIKPRNAKNNRFVDLESYYSSYTNGINSPVNRAILGKLSKILTEAHKNKCYKISFWAAGASFCNYKDALNNFCPFSNDIIDISLIDALGNETKIKNPNPNIIYTDSSIFSPRPIVTNFYCADPPCNPIQIPVGNWNYYEAIFNMDTANYPYNYTEIAFKLNRLITNGNDVPDVFIDDVGLYELDSTNLVSLQPDTLKFCTKDTLYPPFPTWFSVTTLGSKTLNYTWQYSTNKTNWNNLTNNVSFGIDSTNTFGKGLLEYLYYYRNIKPGYNYFRCIITGMACGALTSDIGTLYVVPAPSISISTPDFYSSICVGAVLTATASINTSSYQWLKNNTVIQWTGINTFTADSAGAYTCVITDSCGSATSNSITVYPNPVITTKTDTITTCPGYPGRIIELYASITGGSEPYEYEWDNFLANIKDSTKSSLTINTDSLNFPEVYTCIVGDANNCATSKTLALINFYATPVISEQPNSISICKGDTTKFSIVTADTGISYQWCRVHTEFIPPHITIIIDDGINGATKNKYIILETTPSDTGIYTCLLTNIYGCITTSEYVTLKLHPQPIITQQPDSAFICSGDTAEFSITANGDSLSYQWYVLLPDIRPEYVIYKIIDGATNQNLFIPDTSNSISRYYKCFVTNKFGCTTTGEIGTLSVITPPALIADANSVSGEYAVCPRGGTLELNLAANPTGGMNCNGNWEYSWFNGNKYWDGTAFNSLIPKWNENYENISFTATDTAVYTVTVRCDSMVACRNSSSSVKVTILKDVANIYAVIGNPANGLINAMKVSWNKVEGADYELEFSKDNSAWSGNLLRPNYNDTSYADTIVDYPNSPCFFQVKTYFGTVSCGDWVPTLDTAFTACDNPVLFDSSATDNTITLKLLNDSNPAYTLYAIYCMTTNQYVENTGLLGGYEEFQTKEQWGHSLRKSASITVKGLRPDSTYCFYALARNKRGDIRSDSVPVCISTGACVQLSLSPPATSHYTMCAGDSLTLNVEASGTTPYTYQWLKNGIYIEGANKSTVTLKNMEATDNSVYNCRVSNYCGTDTSGNITIVVKTKLLINTIEEVRHKNRGDSITLSVSVSGGGVGASYSYDWYHNNNESGITNYEFTIDSLTSGDGGVYSCRVTDSCGSTKQDIVTLIIDNAYEYGLYGEVVYDNKSETGLCHAMVKINDLDSAFTDSVMTNNTNGDFQFDNLKTGRYVITAKTNLAWGGGNPLDALIINRYYIGKVKSFGDALKKTAADVNDDGKINPIDALLVNRRYIGAIKSFNTGNWCFQTDTVNLTTDKLVTIKGVCFGDVNGDYNVNTLTATCGNKSMDITPGHGFNQDVVSLVDSCQIMLPSLVAKPGDTVKFALWIKDSTRTGAWGVRIQIDTNVLTFIDTLLNIDDTLNNTGGVGYARVQDTISLAWDNSVSNEFFYMRNKRLLTLAFIYNGGETALTFLPGSMVGNDSLQEDNVTFLNGNIGPLYLTSQPENSSQCSGGSAQFSVGAVGDSTGVEYQWITSIIENGKLKSENLRDSGVFTGTSTGTLNISDVTGMDSVQFRCIVSNGYGSVTSQAGLLTVNEAPIINNQSGDTTLCSGASTSFSVMATGTEPLSYQWQFESIDNGQLTMENVSDSGVYSGVNTVVLNISDVTGLDGNDYICIISNACGNVTSRDIILTVNDPVSITEQPVSSDICEGAWENYFYVTATGNGTIGYQWFKNDTAITNDGNNNFYYIYDANINDGGLYKCLLSNMCGTVTSDSVSLNISTPISILQQPENDTTCIGTDATFKVRGSSLSPYTYQWYTFYWDYGNNIINGATDSILTIHDASDNDAMFYYYCKLSNECGTVVSDYANLALNTNININQEPTSEILCTGTGTSAPTTLSLAATGNPINYQWYKQEAGNWEPDSGATQNYLYFNSVNLADSDNYFCLLSNDCGIISSDTVYIKVHANINITQQVKNDTICNGNNAEFSIKASGTKPLSYEWYYSYWYFYEYEEISPGGGTYYVPMEIEVKNSIGTNDSVLIINNADANDATYKYSCTVTNACNSVQSDYADLIIYDNLTINQQPLSNLTQTTGSTQTFYFGVTGTTPIKYQWYKIINNEQLIIDNATNSNFTIDSVTTNNDGYYRCIATNYCGSITSDSVFLTIHTPLTIIWQPQSMNACNGDSVSFSITASGTGPFSYQWIEGYPGYYWDINGAEDSLYTMNNLSTNDEYYYQCVITNGYETVSSNWVYLTVNSHLQITQQTLNNTLCIGSTQTFSVAATGTAPISYQWIKNDTIVIDGATEPSYTKYSITTNDAGTYYCILTNCCGTIASDTVTLTVGTYPTIAKQSINDTACTGSDGIFSVTPAGTAPYTYQWYMIIPGYYWIYQEYNYYNGYAINGATDSVFTINDVTQSNAEYYYCIVSNYCGSVNSTPAYLSVDNYLSITQQPVSNIIQTKWSTQTFYFGVTGTTPIKYQWYKIINNEQLIIDNATNSNFTIDSVTTNNDGYYRCIATNYCGSITSDSVFLTVHTPLTIIWQPQSMKACNGDSVSFSITASGTGPFSYQWIEGYPGYYWDINGAEDSLYTMNNLSTNDEYYYQCVITNGYETVSSNWVYLTVNSHLQITQQPMNNTLCTGSTQTFSVAATGTSPISYQWIKNDTIVIEGATESAYTMNSSSTNDAGTYYCTLTNCCGIIASDTVSLTVRTYPTIAKQSINDTACTGSDGIFSVTPAGTAPYTYQWYMIIPGYYWIYQVYNYYNGYAINGATDSVFEINDVTQSNAEYYYCIVSNYCGSVNSTPAYLNVDNYLSIIQQPQSVYSCEPTTISFNVETSWSYPISYQWYKLDAGNWTIFTGATQATLMFNPVSKANDGNYVCVISNYCGKITSDTVTLNYSTPISIIQQPKNDTVCIGADANFQTSGYSLSSYTYQWYKTYSYYYGEYIINGATDSIYTIKGVSADDAEFIYYCKLSNACGTVISSYAGLTLNSDFSIDQQSLSDTVCSGTSISLNVHTTGTDKYSYKWLKNGNVMTGDGMYSVITNTLILDSITTGNAGEYIAIVSNSCGSVTSDTMNLTVNTPPLITSQTKDTTLCVGNSTSLSVHAIGTVPLTYSWYKNGDIMPSVSTNTLILDSITTGNAGNYSTIVSNECGSKSSDTISLVVQSPPVIQNNFDTITKYTGDAITLYANVTGSMPQYYQWMKDSINLLGQTSDSLQLDSLKLTDAGLYSCNVSNMCRDTTANIARLYVDTMSYRKISQQNKPSLNNGDNIKVKIYPNPNDGSFTLEINLPVEGNIEIEGYDVIGREVLSKINYLQKGESFLKLRIDNPISGIYMINVRTDKEVVNRKLIIEN